MRLISSDLKTESGSQKRCLGAPYGLNHRADIAFFASSAVAASSTAACA